MQLANLPNELIIAIAYHVGSDRRLSLFSRTSRRIHGLVMPLLYQRDIKYFDGRGVMTILARFLRRPLGAPRESFFAEEEEDLEEYHRPSQLTTPEGLPLPETEDLVIQDKVIQQFVKHGAVLDRLIQVECNIREGITLLHLCALRREAACVILMIKNGADVDAVGPDEEERTVLHWAAIGGSAKIIRFLIQKGANVNAQCWEGKTPLHHAAEEGVTAAIRLLMEAGANIDAQDDDGFTPLHLMMMNGKPAPDVWCIPALKTLFEYSPNTELGMFEDGKTALHVAILNTRDMNFMETLLELGVDVNARTVEGRTPLSCCLERAQMSFFNVLVKAGADMHTTDEQGRGLLEIALEDEDRAYSCLPDLLEGGFFSLGSDAGHGETLAQALTRRGWVYTVKDRVENMPEIDELDSD